MKIGPWDYVNRQRPLLKLYYCKDYWALCRRTLESGRHRYAIALLPDILGTDSMAVDGIDGCPRVRREEGNEPASKISPDSAWAWTISGLARDRTAEPVSLGPDSQARISRLTHDGTVEPVSRDLSLRRERG